MVGISIHALCEEGDVQDPLHAPTRGHFYPRPLRGGRLPLASALGVQQEISIHALCEEGDFTVPVHGQPEYISIHALCEEGDMRTSGPAA